MDGDRERDQERRLTLTEAAEVLGTSKDAVRMRVRRGTIRSEKGEDGRVYVFLEPDPHTVHTEPQIEDSSSPLVEVLRDEISHLRRESERKDAIIMSLSQGNAELSRTIREIEAPASPSAASESAQERRGEGSEGSSTPGQGEGLGGDSERRPWWRRVFGG